MTTGKRKQKEQPKLTTPKRLFVDMMDAAHASGMPCDRINAVADAVHALESAVTGLILCRDYRENATATREMTEARKAHFTWIGGNDEKA